MGLFSLDLKGKGGGVTNYLNTINSIPLANDLPKLEIK